MNVNDLIPVVTLLVALSITSERLVEIIKGIWTWLGTEKTANTKEEGYRRAILYLLAMVSGFVTAFTTGKSIGWDQLGFPANTHWMVQCLALGLLASGGSGFWNSILSNLVAAKAIKGTEARAATPVN